MTANADDLATARFAHGRTGGLPRARTLRPIEALAGVDCESGSGKTTLARAIVGLQPLTSGSVTLLDSGHRHGVQLIFQDPGAALDWRQAIASALAEAALLAGERDRDAQARTAARLLTSVGLDAGGCSPADTHSGRSRTAW